ncbi:MAG: PP2C family serine/threonine-protein phosphatase [Acidimicrobiales bacterium]
MELLGATVTHVGNVRESNQDRGHFGGYVAVVADGMGGHQGGETAATIAISEFVGITEPVGPSGLVELVEDANRAVFERAADPDLRGMGTTLVALTLRPAEGKISVVNVGDSRAYVVDGHALQQLTNDHSLVEDLVRQKRLTPEEAAHHPQRNILTRALGISSHVEVDQFLRQTRVGDRFLLCSDGLFNEVSEDDILRILTSYASPLEAAQTLVASALAGAGRDNITVVVVDVVEDGHGGSLTPPAEAVTVPAMPAILVDTDPAALADAGFDNGQGGPAVPPAAGAPNGAAPGAGLYAEAGQSHRPPSLARPAGTVLELDTASSSGVAGLEAQPAVNLGAGGPDHTMVAPTGPAPDAAVATAEIANEPPGTYTTFEPDADEPRRGRRAVTLVALGVLLGALVAAAYLGIGYYNRSIWFVKQVDGGQVAIFNGRPGGLLWLEPERQADEGPQVGDLIPEDQDEVAQQPTFKSEAEAKAFVDSLMLAGEMVKDQAEQLGGVEASTTVPVDPTATTVPAGGLVTVPGSVGAAGGAAPASPATTDPATANAANAVSPTTSAG